MSDFGRRSVYRIARAMLGALVGSLLATGVAMASPVEDEKSIWKMVILGLPLGVMTASMFASALRSMKEPARPDQDIPKRVAAIIFDGMAGGYLAMFVVGFSMTKGYVADVLPPVLGALFAILMQWLHDNWKPYFDQLFKALLNLLPSFAKRRPPDEPAGGA